MLAHYFRTLNTKLVLFIYRPIVLLNLKWWGIRCGYSLKVNGRIRLKRKASSTIIIGNNCTFNSRPNSNLIGVNRPCMISTLSDNAILQIGDNCGFSGTVIGAFESIIIGNNVRCGANTLITDADWHLDDYRAGEPRPVIIEDGVWLGEGVKVMKGVTIGENSLIGAGSIVIKDIPANVVAAGNPCKVIKPIQ